MKKITLWLFALFTCWQISAQTTVTIGTGTSSATGGTNGNPIYRSSATSTFNFSQSIQLLTAADLAAAGVTSGATITKIAFYKNDAFTMSAGRTATMNIYLKNSSATALTTASNFSTWTTGSTNCYSNTAIGPANFPAAAGWVEYTLTTPFSYSGGAIETAIDWAINAGAGNATTGAFSWLYTTSTAIKAVGTSNSTAITANLATSQLRQYNTQITFTTTPCSGIPAPGNTIAPSPICSGSSATLSLQNSTIGSGVTYQWYMNSSPISGANSGVYVIPSVTSVNNYYCDVTCSGNTTSSSTIAVVPTLLTAPTSIETFATYLPSCWLFGDNGDLASGPATFGSNLWKNDGFANSGATGSIAYNHYTTGTNDWIISPVISVPATGYELKFDAALTQWEGTTAPTTAWDAGDVLEVLISTTGLNNWSVIYTIDNTNPPSASGSAIAIDLDAYATQNIRIAYRVVSGATDGPDDTDIFVDNFEVRLSPTCPDQTGLTIGTLTASTADTSWDNLSTFGAVGYQYAITTSATPPASGTSTTATNYAATGLSPQTVYYLHVRTECAASVFGNWATTTFTTGCAPLAVLPWSENFDALTTGLNVFPACWAYTNTTSNWSISTSPVAYSGANSLRRTWSTDGWAFTPNTTLTAGTSYRFSYYVRTNDAVVGYDITVGVGTSQTSAAMTTTLSTVAGYQGAAWVKVIHEFTPTLTGDYTFGVHVVAPVDPNGINFDDFKIELSPTCPDQTGLTIGAVSSSTADTSWDNLTTFGAVGYQYAVTTSATPPASGTSTTATYYAATGLSPLTVYYLHVRAECSGSTYGVWATTTFTTACAPFSVPVLEPFNTFLPNTCWTEADNGDLTVGPAIFGSGSWLEDGFGNVGTTGAARVTLDAAADNDWIISPEFTIPATGYELKFDAAATQSVLTTAPSTAWESDDFVEVLVSTTNTTNWTPLFIYNDVTYPSNTGSVNILDLDAYSGQNIRFAFRAVEGATNGAASIDFSIDNFQIRLTPTCIEPLNLVSSTVTATTANVSWDPTSPVPTTGYEYFVSTSNTTPVTPGTATTNTYAILSSLLPQTTYYIFVRSDCSAGDFSAWTGPISFTTTCASITTLPWNEGFESLATVGTTNFPPCWFKQNGEWASQNTASTYSTANTGTKYIRDSWSATNEFMWTPGFDLVAGTSYDFSSFVQGDNGTGWVVDYFVNSVQNSTGATQLGASYNVPGTGSPYTFQPYAQITRSFVPGTTGTYYFAVRVNQPSSLPWYVSFDDFELKLSPSIPPACTTNLVATPNACGNFSNNLTWNVEPTATGYYLTIGTTSGGTDIANAVNVGSNSYSFSGTIATTYFWTVTPYNAAGSATGCTEQSFITAATGCFCTSVPSSLDNSGITSAIVGATTNPISVVTYTDLTATAEVVNPGTNTNVQLTFSTGYTYDINIWIDFNNDFDFDDAGELVKTGIACTVAQPNTVDASFIMPLSAPSGPHRMRIGTSDTGQVPPNACYNGSYGVTLDFRVDTTLGSASFDTSNFVAYPNPVKDVLNLSYKNAISNVRVINLLGQEVLNTKANTNEVQVNMSALTAGAYIVNITVEDTVHTIKIIKE